MNIFEGGFVWDQIISRYDTIQTTQILNNFAQDPDLKLILKQSLKILERQVLELENTVKTYEVPLPKRPPASSTSTLNVEVITDDFIFRTLLRGIQEFIPKHAMTFIHSTSPKFREMQLKYLIEELKLYDQIFLYGQLKGWVLDPPAYRT